MKQADQLRKLADEIMAGNTFRSINIRIMAALHPEYELEVREAVFGDSVSYYLWKDKVCVMSHANAPDITNSLDTVAYWQEKLVPEMDFCLKFRGSYPSRSYSAYFGPFSGMCAADGYEAPADLKLTEANVRCAALLRAYAWKLEQLETGKVTAGKITGRV